jgi:hypothetical protein
MRQHAVDKRDFSAKEGRVIEIASSLHLRLPARVILRGPNSHALCDDTGNVLYVREALASGTVLLLSLSLISRCHQLCRALRNVFIYHISTRHPMKLLWLRALSG